MASPFNLGEEVAVFKGMLAEAVGPQCEDENEAGRSLSNHQLYLRDMADQSLGLMSIGGVPYKAAPSEKLPLIAQRLLANSTSKIILCSLVSDLDSETPMDRRGLYYITVPMVKIPHATGIPVLGKVSGYFSIWYVRDDAG